jgi:hypothetical protein
MQPSDTIANSCKFKLFLTKVEKAGNPPDSNGVTFFLPLNYHRAHNGLSLGPSSLLRHTLLSRTDYDSYTHVADSILVLLLVVLATCDSD